LDKTRQALREGAPDIMKELSPEDGEDDEDGDLSSPLQRPRVMSSSVSRDRMQNAVQVYIPVCHVDVHIEGS
jgi:hypothetical protein